MPVNIRFLPRRGLVFFSYLGLVTADDIRAACRTHRGHPDGRPGQRQLIDLAGVTGFLCDPCSILVIQAEQLDLYATDGSETLLVYHAPTRISRHLAHQVLRPRAPVKGVIARLQETEADALALLGQPETSFAALLDPAGLPRPRSVSRSGTGCGAETERLRPPLRAPGPGGRPAPDPYGDQFGDQLGDQFGDQYGHHDRDQDLPVVRFVSTRRGRLPDHR